jgi:hypothetical protein
MMDVALAPRLLSLAFFHKEAMLRADASTLNVSAFKTTTLRGCCFRGLLDLTQQMFVVSHGASALLVGMV